MAPTRPQTGWAAPASPSGLPQPTALFGIPSDLMRLIFEMSISPEIRFAQQGNIHRKPA